MENQRPGLFEALGADADGVALDVIDGRQPFGYIAVEMVGVAANGNGRQVIASAHGDDGGDFVVGGDLLTDIGDVPR